jgi:DNA invertase Pin-like site-specific DNA recombinase
LVLKVFNPIENPENFQCNHINGIKNDNRLENLEWCTPSENIKHAYRIGLAINAKKGILLSDETKRKMSENHKDVNGEKNPNCRLSNEDLIKIKELLMEGILSQRKIAKIYSVHNTTISRIKRGVTRKHLY